MATSASKDEIKRVNRLEILLFTLGGEQRFGINVLKVRELMPCPALRKLPGAHSAICGVAHLRGITLSVIDLARAVGKRRLGTQQDCAGNLVITEFNRVSHGFLVDKIDRITVLDWSDVRPPSAGLSRSSYITGVANINNNLVQILDVERVLEEIGVYHVGDISDVHDTDYRKDVPIMVVDDSSIALKQTKRTLEQLGLGYIAAKDGVDALRKLKEMASRGNVHDQISMIISDIEMPEMDGYSLTQEIRADNRLKDMYVLLHSSLNGIMNNRLAERVGANAALTKFVPDDLAREVVKALAV